MLSRREHRELGNEYREKLENYRKECEEASKAGDHMKLMELMPKMMAMGMELNKHVQDMKDYIY